MPETPTDHGTEPVKRTKGPSPTSPDVEQKPTIQSGTEHGGMYTHFREALTATGKEPPPEQFSSLFNRPEIAHPVNDMQKACILGTLQQQFGNRYVHRMLTPGSSAETSPLISAPIQRKEEPAVSETSGSASSLPQVQIDRSSGQPLDADACAFMESRFGHDFSDVRVHTDSKAREASQNLNAEAFTTGHDIYFSQGAYDPVSERGRRLIAHELTHVVQQGNNPSIPTAIGDTSAVSEPSDSHELEADQIAQAIMGGSAPEKVHSSPHNLGTSRLIHRRATIINAPWWGNAPSGTSDSNVWFNPHAELWMSGGGRQDNWFPGSDVADFTVSPGTKGTIRIWVDVGWFQDNVIFNYSGRGRSIIDVSFTVSPQGDLTLQEPSRQEETGSDGAQLVFPVVVLKGTTPSGGYVTVSPTILSAGSVSSGVKVGATGGVSSQGISAGFSSELIASESTPRVGAWTRSFSVNLNVPRPEIRPPRTHSYSTSAGFQVGSDRVEEGTEGHVVGWYMGLPEQVKNAVRTGATQILLEGHASTTQPGPANRRLSRRRAERVQEILRDIAGSNAKFEIFAFGEYQARTPDQVEDETERVVNISITVQESQEQQNTPVPNPSGP